MQIKKIRLDYDLNLPDRAKIMVYSDKGTDVCFLKKDARHWAVEKIWSENFFDFFRSVEGARLADALGAVIVFAECYKYVGSVEWTFDLRKDIFNGIKAFAAEGEDEKAE